jgi:ubiquinone biosynthesis protein
MQTAEADEIIAAAEDGRVLQQASNGKYIQKARAVASPPAIRRRVLYRFFLLYRHVIGLLAGSHLAYVNGLPAEKRRWFHTAGARFFALLLRPWVKKELRRLPFETQLRRRLEMLGPTYIKLGQIMAIREDILPKKITDELKQLLDRLPEVPFETIQPIIEKSLNASIEELFLDVNKDPLGSASIAQTHLAKTKKGERVVIKVIKPGIREAILSDIKLLQILAGILEWLIPRYQPKMIIDEFCAYTEKEINLTFEADHAEIFAANFAHTPDVVFPKIYRQFTSTEVLCMEYLEGLKPSDPQVLELGQENLQRVIDL